MYSKQMELIMFCLFFPPFSIVGDWGGGVSWIPVVVIPRRHEGKLAVVNEPKWSPVIHSLICPSGPERGLMGRGSSWPPGPLADGESAEVATEVRAMTAVFSCN